MKNFKKLFWIMMIFSVIGFSACVKEEIPTLPAPHTEYNEQVQSLIDKDKNNGTIIEVTSNNQAATDAKLDIVATSYDSTETSYVIHGLQGRVQSDSLLAGPPDIYIGITDGEKVIYSEKIFLNEPFQLNNISWTSGPREPAAKTEYVYLCNGRSPCHCFRELKPVK